jgi:CHAD domain-containing protein
MTATKSDFDMFAERLTAGRVERLAEQLDRASEDRSPDAVHDLRVAARRLLSTLDCFRGALQGTDFRILRKRAKSILAAGRSVRDRDIALELAREAGLNPLSPVVGALERQRAEAADTLRRQIRRKRFRDFAGKWLGKLGR